MKSLRKSILAVVGVCLIAACPLAGSATLGKHVASASSNQYQPVVSFEPSIAPLELTSIAETAFAEPISTPASVATTEPGPAVATITEDTIVIDGQSYPIGDSFLDASQIPLGAIEDGRFGEHGYATILAVGAQDYRLIWIAEGGERKHLIVREDNTAFSGPDGFTAQLENLIEAEEMTFDAVGIELGGLAGILGAEFAICPVTGGAGCAAAVVTGATALFGGFALTLWRVFGDLIPAYENVQSAFELIDINAP